MSATFNSLKNVKVNLDSGSLRAHDAHLANNSRGKIKKDVRSLHRHKYQAVSRSKHQNRNISGLDYIIRSMEGLTWSFTR